jgi:glycosyltransferase involved in cell wall biosynthesis
MRVAFIEQESLLGGVEYSTLRAAQALNQSRFDPVIICPEEGDLPRLARQVGLNIQIVPRPKFSSVSTLVGNRYVANPLGFFQTAINVIRAARTLQDHLQANPADVVVTKGLLAHFYGGMAARRQQAKCIWYVQEEVDPKRAAGFYRTMLIWGAQRFPAKIIVDAAALIEQFNRTPALRDTIEVVYNGIDTEQFAPFPLQDLEEARRNLDIPENALVIGQTGRLIPLKGQATLFQAFTRLEERFPDLHLLFVGAPLFGSQEFERQLKTRAAEWGLAERVHFSGFLPDVRQGLAAMDIFVHASVETDSPLSVSEAMSCGLPVVVSNVRGTLEMVSPDSNALVFEPGNPEALVVALEKIIRSKPLREELSTRARATVKEKFSLQASVDRLQAIFEEVYAA